ncbi:MAG: hypothetical protein A2514_15580 [Gammaproteobacteria bacterium RIFOXYD12_FULL_61_37]|nr:MAG: hypothetical protein A2514_15580 [Gammaproteobacteria bacterium RIFOXYD12_FULL_61_37]
MKAVDPNIILTIDDSGSMDWSYMPDAVSGSSGTKRGKSSSYNKIYYDPNITYEPPVDSTGTSLGHSSFTAAWADGYHQSSTCTINLSTSFRAPWSSANACTGGGGFAGPTGAAYYYRFDATNGSCNGTVTDEDCYDLVTVSATSGPGSTDERTNFANWYSYYNRRIYIMKAAASRAFANLSDNFRVSHQTINRPKAADNMTTMTKFTGTERTNFYTWLFNVGASGGTPLRAAMQRAGAYLETAVPWRETPSVSTSPEIACRQSFHVMMTDGYWNGAAGVNGNVDNSSQTLPANDYNITSYSPRAPYKDNNSSFLADNAFHYWYRDLRPTLANEVPTHMVDLSSDIDGDGDVDISDQFWNPANDPAKWQHMVNFTVGLGVNGQRIYPDDYAALLAGTKTWPNDEIDDLWHAAIDSRGKYFSASNAEEMVTSFTEAIQSIVDRTGSSAPVALSVGSISSNSLLFQAKFDTAGWKGHLLAYRISNGSNCGSAPVGAICSGALWDAACRLDGGACAATGGSFTASPTFSNRMAFTLNSSTGLGVRFAWDKLSTSQQDSLRDPDGPAGPLPADTVTYGQNRLNFLLGDDSNETNNGGVFRNRTTILGDIIYSNPVYVGAPGRYYESKPDFAEGASYHTFKTSKAARNPMVYVGANDGMLHGFDTSDGVEKLAYLPKETFFNLWKLSRPDYLHTNYVDGPLAEGDVYYDKAWHTLLVGGLGLGGQGYFALDVTDPANFTFSNEQHIPRWEFTDADDADLGYSYGKPQIVRLRNGVWAAVFGSGFDNTEGSDGHLSTTGNAAVFIVNIKTGVLIKKLDTGVGRSADPTGQSRPNAILGVTPVDMDGDYVTDRLYAGDLFGNLWVWDLSKSNPNQWRMAHGNGVPLFIARNAAGTAQPITTTPVVTKHPYSWGAVVYFGTGKFYGTSDMSDTSVQSFYGIWDAVEDIKGRSPRTNITRASLLKQSVVSVNLTQFGATHARIVSDCGITWDDYDGTVDSVNVSTFAAECKVNNKEVLGWYMDLPESGERVHQEATVRNGRVIYVTVTPSVNTCQSGGSSWLMEVDATDGSRLPTTVFDYNGDGVFTQDDMVADGSGGVVVGSGIQRDGSGIFTKPGIVADPGSSSETKFTSTSSGQVVSVKESSGLNQQRSWRELR